MDSVLETISSLALPSPIILLYYTTIHQYYQVSDPASNNQYNPFGNQGGISKLKNHILQGDRRSAALQIWRGLVGVLLMLLGLRTFLADTDLDLDLLFSFSLSSISSWRGVLFSFSSLLLGLIVAFLGLIVAFLGLIPAPSTGCANASSQLILSSSFLRRHLRMKSLDVSEMAGSKTMGLQLMLLMSCNSLLAGHGVNPCSISQKISPTDHKSDLLVYCCWFSNCGDMYRGVPTIDFRMVLSPLSRLRANPKSLIFSLFQLMRMLAGLRSLCIVSSLFMYQKPLTISLRNATASVYVSFFLRLRQVLKSPPSQNSVTMYILLLVWQTSSSLTIFQCYSFFMMSISECMFLRLQWLAKMRFSITLTATAESLVVSLPKNTEAYEPLPRRWFMEYMYFSIFFSPYDSCLPFASLAIVVKILYRHIYDRRIMVKYHNKRQYCRSNVDMRKQDQI